MSRGLKDRLGICLGSQQTIDVINNNVALDLGMYTFFLSCDASINCPRTNL